MSTSNNAQWCLFLKYLDVRGYEDDMIQEVVDKVQQECLNNTGLMMAGAGGGA
jgi:hypothetical protein